MIRRRPLSLLLAATLGIGAALPACADFKQLRRPSEAEQRQLVAALLVDPQMPMSEDPSCKADLSRPGAVPVHQALADALSRAAAERPVRVVRVDCFARPGYPLEPGQEYCRLAFVPAGKARDDGFGIAFRMDWTRRAVVPGSAECY